MKKRTLKDLTTAAAMVCLTMIALPAASAAQSGTLARRLATVSDAGSVTLEFGLGPVIEGSSSLMLQFAEDGSGAPGSAPTLGSGVNFALTRGSEALSFPIGSLPSSNTTFTDKSVTMSQSGGPQSYVLTINHLAPFSSVETWTLQISGLPTGSTPPLRALATVQGQGLAVSGTGFTSLTPTGPCATGGDEDCPACPVCPGRIIDVFPWKEVPIIFCSRCPPPIGPGPVCLTCPPDWSRPFDEERFDRTLIRFAAYGQDQQLLGPGQADRIQLDIQNGEAIGAIFDGGKGWYLQMIQHPVGESPQVTYRAAGFESSPVTIERDEANGDVYETLTWVFGILFGLAVATLVAVTRRASRRSGAARG